MTTPSEEYRLIPSLAVNSLKLMPPTTSGLTSGSGMRDGIELVNHSTRAEHIRVMESSTIPRCIGSYWAWEREAVTRLSSWTM